MFGGTAVPKRVGLAKMGALALLLGASTLVALRYAAKYGWLAGTRHWATYKPRDAPYRWYI